MKRLKDTATQYHYIKCLDCGMTYRNWASANKHATKTSHTVKEIIEERHLN